MKSTKHIVHRFYDLYSGGAEVVIINIIKALPKSWHHTLIFNNYWDTWVSKTLKDMKNVTLEHIKNNKEFITIIDNRKPDIILCHWYPPMNEYDVIALEEAKHSPKIIVYSHWTKNIPPVKKADRFIFVSNYCEETFGKDIEEDKKSVLYNPVADELFIDNPPVIKKRKEFVIGRHSRPVSLKFPGNFFDMYEVLDIPDLEIRVLGGDIFIPYEDVIKKAKKKKYTFLPFNSTSTVQFLDDLDLYVYTVYENFYDAFSLCIIEALARGLVPVVERKGGNIEQIVHGETGFLCDTKEDFKKYIEELYHDQELRKTMSHNALLWVKENCSMKIFKKKIKKLLTEW